MARLRLLFALFLLILGTWFGALAVGGNREPALTTHTAPPPAPHGPSSVDASQFISLVSRERFVAGDAPVATTPVKTLAPKTAAKTKPPAIEKRPQQAATQLPWPLSLFSN